LRGPVTAASRRLGVLALAVGLLGSGVAHAECPAGDAVLQKLDEFDSGLASRTLRFGQPPAGDLYREAAKKPGSPVVTRDGKKLSGAILIDLPVELLWKALNDEDHHALEEDYMPVRHSEVIGGTPRGEDRLLFQYFKQAGVGRWWVSRVEMNSELYEQSEGRMWELRWQDSMENIDPAEPPMSSVSENISPLEESHGAWLLMKINDECTMIDYYTHSDPGGFAGLAQAFVAKRAIRSTLSGVVTMAREHVTQPHPDAVFVRADGVPLD
jgi:hypothetical protein